MFMGNDTPTNIEQLAPAKFTCLTVWSRSCDGVWLIERSYADIYVRNVLRIPAGQGRLGDDGRYYIALPQGVHPSPLVRHPASGEFPAAIPLVSKRAS